MRMRHVGLVLGIGLIGLAAMMPAVSRAQAPLVEGEAAGSLVTDPAAIGRCLCAGGRISADKETLDSSGRRYAAAKAHADATRAAVDRVRPQLRPDNAEQLDAFRRLVDESQRAEHDLYSVAQPDYSAAVTRYNQSVAAYNGGCAGMRVDKALQARVATSLVCPAP